MFTFKIDVYPSSTEHLYSFELKMESCVILLLSTFDIIVNAANFMTAKYQAMSIADR